MWRELRRLGRNWGACGEAGPERGCGGRGEAAGSPGGRGAGRGGGGEAGLLGRGRRQEPPPPRARRAPARSAGLETLVASDFSL